MSELKKGLALDLAVANAMDFPCTAGGSHEWKTSLATGCEKCGRMLPLYSTDIAQAFKVEDTIAELGLKHTYCQALAVIVADAVTERGRVVDHFDFIHASPEQRCRAALECVKEKAKAASG